jgi:signal transduction histidine kinase
VEAHGGSVAIRSREGEGTVATVVLPVRPRAR